MKIKINLTKKQIIPIISAVIILIGIIFVYAQSSPNPGHSINEIGGIPDCTSSQSLTHNTSGFFCVSNSVIGGSVDVSGNLTVTNSLFIGLEQVNRSATASSITGWTSVNCSTGKKVISCASNNCYINRGAFPNTESSCACNFMGTRCNCVATCANIDS